ncbi:hypothetical protein RHMOL_Rhmol01G0307700 [Rhododendron molle]|uniref:Uncharacterized protein n=1 Tax=Rhododendron molle TaxID=49168 RepID=A0ACC0QAJ4_RHOML|nr:hypothetical protein RHMOL_Rhmol01G0307700 [Rhododendron molle]
MVATETLKASVPKPKRSKRAPTEVYTVDDEDVERRSVDHSGGDLRRVVLVSSLMILFFFRGDNERRTGVSPVRARKIVAPTPHLLPVLVLQRGALKVATTGRGRIEEEYHLKYRVA